MVKLSHSFVILFLGLGFVACSNQAKIRQEAREKAAATSGLFCDFINGDEFKDVEIELTLSMAKRCDASKPSTITAYKNASEVHGIIYCCALTHKEKEKEKEIAHAAERAEKAAMKPGPTAPASGKAAPVAKSAAAPAKSAPSKAPEKAADRPTDKAAEKIPLPEEDNLD